MHTNFSKADQCETVSLPINRCKTLLNNTFRLFVQIFY